MTTAVSLMSPEFRTLLGAMHAREYLEAGVSSVRVVGHSGIQGDIALRDAINAGLAQANNLRRARNGAASAQMPRTSPTCAMLPPTSGGTLRPTTRVLYSA